MSRRIILVVEGDTEEEFVRSSIAPYFQRNGIHDIRGIKITTSPGHKGGIGSYLKFRNNVEQFIKQEKEIVVSCLLDYFRLPTSFPRYDEAVLISNSTERVTSLEKAMGEDIDHHRFIPYLQLHEFEALMFTNLRGFEYCGFTPVQIREILAVIKRFESPEDINNNPETAPSKRLTKIIPGYNKVLYGNVIIQENGFHQILDTCKRFSNWIQHLIVKAKE